MGEVPDSVVVYGKHYTREEWLAAQLAATEQIRRHLTKWHGWPFSDRSPPGRPRGVQKAVVEYFAIYGARVTVVFEDGPWKTPTVLDKMGREENKTELIRLGRKVRAAKKAVQDALARLD